MDCFRFLILYLINMKILSEQPSSLLMSLLVESDQRCWEALEAWEKENVTHCPSVSLVLLMADGREVPCYLCL